MKGSTIKRTVIATISGIAILGTIFIADYSIQLWRNQGAVAPGTESRIGGTFSLLDHNGQHVSEQSFANRHKLIFFGFTHCPDVCPTTLSQMSTLLKNIGPLADQLYPLFITVDPERDTPQRLRQYSVAFNPNIVYLTGTSEEIEHVLTAWQVTRAKYAVGEKDYSLEHSSVLYLMSPENVLIKSYSADQPAKDIERSLKKYLK